MPEMGEFANGYTPPVEFHAAAQFADSVAGCSRFFRIKRLHALAFVFCSRLRMPGRDIGGLQKGVELGAGFHTQNSLQFGFGKELALVFPDRKRFERTA